MEEKNYTTFIDNAGRAIFGEVQEETQDTIQVRNPVMIAVNQQQNGQMAVQLFPIFFQEFVTESETTGRSNFFTYNKSNIALGTGFTIEKRIAEQYERIVNPVLVPNTPADTSEEPEVIRLFDDE
jgi:hypothetical protein